ncbi:histidine kinase [Ruegeria marisrubri]|uniref:Histidine kinase n=1 Tax=Ruegeria marisrubri TaxID=1685379 RepID=A0A101CYZ4_9RHOB|nr:CBS domain-containing protein [Ruegeria marisrubri]KUJ85824.1 histidine kinase [Ruegeria marisrubri]
MLVQAILKTKATEGVVSVPSSTTISDVAKILAEKRIGTVVISDDDGATALGILSERDIVRELAVSGSGCLFGTAGTYMTKNVVTCGRNDKVQDILQKMTEGRFRHVPVLEEGKMIGLISIGDLVKAQLAELAMEKDALQGMIMGH